ncbi:unnamed protein product [Closterium sp. NIES-54]
MQDGWGVSAAGAPAAGDTSAEAACAADAASAEQARCMVHERHAAVVPDAPMVTLVLGAMARLRLVPAAEALWALAEASQPCVVQQTGGAGGDAGEGRQGRERSAQEAGIGEVEGYVWRSKREGRRARGDGGAARREGDDRRGGDSVGESESGAWQRSREKERDAEREGGRGLGKVAWGRLDGMAAAAMVGVYVAAGDLYYAMHFLLSTAAAGLLPTPAMALASLRAPTQAPLPHSPAPATSVPSALSPSSPATAARPAMSPTPLNMVLAALQQASLLRHMDALLLCYLHSPSPALIPPHPASLDSPRAAQAVPGLGGVRPLDPAAGSCLPMPSHPPWARLPWDCPHCLRRRAARAAVRGWGRGCNGWLEEWEGEYGVRVSGGARQRSGAAARGTRVGEGGDGHGAVVGGAECCCCSSSGVVVSKGTCEVMAQGYGRAGMHERAAAVVQYMEEQGYRVAPHLLALLPRD